MAPYDIDSHAHFYSSEREAKAIQLDIRVVVEGKKKDFLISRLFSFLLVE